MNKKVYLGYKPKPTNIQKLKQYVEGMSQSDKVPSPKPLSLNKRK